MNQDAAPPKPQILVVDDEPDLCSLYELMLLREGYEVRSAASLQQARSLIAEHSFDVVITDMRLPDGLGLQLLTELAQAKRPERTIVITAYGSAQNAVEALRQGAYDYLTKPVDLKQFRSIVRGAVHALPGSALGGALQATHHSSTSAIATGEQGTANSHSQSTPSPTQEQAVSQLALDRLVGQSPVMQNVKARIVKVARSMAPVLIRGESGTGKELVARALHSCSHRALGPFVPVNCGAIPEPLLEAEFFGALKGAYTGATQDRKGFFQAASGGTLFLDEIGDLPLPMQAKLLRAIQERSVRPLGQTTELPVDVRLLSATHKDLASEVAAGHFRQDLYYRLNVIEIIVPPLRERQQDIPLLTDALLKRITLEAGLPPIKPPAWLLTKLKSAALPGNVRELENLLHRAVALGDIINTQDPSDAFEDHSLEPESSLDLHGNDFQPTQPSALSDDRASGSESEAAGESLPHDLTAWIDEQERKVLIQALELTNYNRTAAAALLGLNLRQIRYRIARLNINMPGSSEDNSETLGDSNDA